MARHNYIMKNHILQLNHESHAGGTENPLLIRIFFNLTTYSQLQIHFNMAAELTRNGIKTYIIFLHCRCKFTVILFCTASFHMVGRYPMPGRGD